MKYYIWGKPDRVPDMLTQREDSLLADQKHMKVHEFDVEDFAAATKYFDGYVARWKETAP